ncbi:MAG: GDP-L-fucose synthase [Candidatus Omnitrophota bacterium]|jgi:GDP-L-fucose synthase
MQIKSGTKVLVVGGAGFIGSNLILKLLSLGADVSGTLHKKKAQVTDSRINYIQVDLMLAADCRRAVEGQELVFMCAANTSGADVMAKTPLVHVTPNVIMNSLVLEASYQAQVKKFVFISSSAAYPDIGDEPVVESQMFEGDPPDVYYPVGWMKRYSEILCRMYSEKIKQPMQTVVVRPSNMFGPYDDYDFKTSHMMAALIRRCVDRHNPFVVWGTGEDIRDLLYIDDFIEGMLAAVEKLSNYEPINIAMGKTYSIKEIVQLILAEDDYDIDLEFDASKPSMLSKRYISTALAEKKLGFKYSTDLKTGIKKTLQWYRQHNKMAKVVEA